MNVIGIDIASRHLDLVKLHEDGDECRWYCLPIPAAATKVELARAVADAVPHASWFEDVYLVACEEPMGQNRQAIAALYTVLGALCASLPPELTVWLLRPAEWKKGVGLPGNLSTTRGSDQLRSWAVEHGADSQWSTDACVALALAYTAREANHAAVLKGLEAA